MKNQLSYALNHLAGPKSTTNRALLLATPTDHLQSPGVHAMPLIRMRYLVHILLWMIINV